MPHSKTNVIPNEKWKGRKFNLKYFKVWGCLAKVQVPIPKRVKIGPKTVDCVFIGYATNSKACRFLIHKSEYPDIHDNTVMESDSAEFFEHIYPYKTRHLVGDLNNQEKNQKRMNLLKKFQDTVNVKGYLLHLDQIL